MGLAAAAAYRLPAGRAVYGCWGLPISTLTALSRCPVLQAGKPCFFSVLSIPLLGRSSIAAMGDYIDHVSTDMAGALLPFKKGKRWVDMRAALGWTGLGWTGMGREGPQLTAVCWIRPRSFNGLRAGGDHEKLCTHLLCLGGGLGLVCAPLRRGPGRVGSVRTCTRHHSPGSSHWLVAPGSLESI